MEQLQTQLNDAKQELEILCEENKRLREQMKVDDIPDTVIVDDEVGLVRKDRLSTLSEPNKRGYSILVGHY